jgi:hypothetical protein
MAQRKIALGARSPRNVTFIDALNETPSVERPDRGKFLMEARGHLDAGESRDVREKLEDWHTMVASATPSARNDLMWKRLNRKGPTSITKTGWTTLREWFGARPATFREPELWLFGTPLEATGGFTQAKRHSLMG